VNSKYPISRKTIQRLRATGQSAFSLLCFNHTLEHKTQNLHPKSAIPADTPPNSPQMKIKIIDKKVSLT
jgi:hypothetical protein